MNLCVHVKRNGYYASLKTLLVTVRSPSLQDWTTSWVIHTELDGILLLYAASNSNGAVINRVSSVRDCTVGRMVSKILDFATDSLPGRLSQSEIDNPFIMVEKLIVDEDALDTIFILNEKGSS